MFSFLKIKRNAKAIFSIVFLFTAILIFLTKYNVKADNSFVSLLPGDVSGFAWMGQNIVPNGGVPQGGGGWLSLNCKPTHCIDSQGNPNNWGVKMDITETARKGQFSGHAWSLNYGWMSFQEDDVSECWSGNPFAVAPGVAKAQIVNGQNTAMIRGWAKFIAGDYEDDGWDGCVSFDGPFNQTYIDLTTGVINGWAWGGEVVGWISFANPECPFCNTSVVLPNLPSISFWASDYDILRGTGTTLYWAANNPNNNYVESCQYTNTSGYNHWQYGSSNSNNVGEISVGSGRLPMGSHPIDNINAISTTYSLSCIDSFGANVPTQYVTITTYREIRGCTDPIALNYDPLANVDDGSCVYPEGICLDPAAANQGDPLPCMYYACTDPAADNYTPPARNIISDSTLCVYGSGSAQLSLDVDRDTLFEGSNDYAVALDWYSNDNLNSCVGSLSVNGGSFANITGWTGARSNPDVYGYTAHNSGPNGFVNLVSGHTAPRTYIFRLQCEDVNGNPVSDTATVNLIRPIVSSEPPVVELFIIQPNNPPQLSLTREEISPVNGANPITLKWTALNVNSCTAISNMYVGNANDGSNTQWDGQSLADDDAFDNTRDVTNMVNASPYLKNTIFTISCIPDNTADYGNAPRTASVCVGLSGEDFTQCSISGTGNIPSYEEI